MQYQVLVQSHSETKFTASVIGIPNATAEGQTREEAILKAKHALQQQLETGELVTIQLDSSSNGQETDPWIKHMGIFADDPTFDDWMAEIAAYRQQVNAQAGEE